MGHEDQFRPPSLNGGCRLGKATFAGMGGKEDAAEAAVYQRMSSTNRCVLKKITFPALSMIEASWVMYAMTTFGSR
jgi:hypothetical protein